MREKPIKLIMELIFIFIIPLIIVCINCNFTNEIEYDNNGNYQSTEKHVEFNPPFTYQTDITNKLYYNQLVNFNGTSPRYNKINDYEIYCYTTYDFIELGSIPVKQNHKYAIITYGSYSLSQDNGWIYINGLVNGNLGLSNLSGNFGIFTGYSNNNAVMRITSYGGYNFSNYTFKLNIIDLTDMFGVGFEPTSKADLFNYIGTSDFQLNTSYIIDYVSSNIISSDYTIDNTIWGTIKNLIIDALQIQNTIIIDIIITYTILFTIMFLIWHVWYGLFELIFHVIPKGRLRC